MKDKKYIIIRNTSEHEFEIGEEVTLFKNYDNEMIARSTTSGRCWYVKHEDLVIAVKETSERITKN